MVDRDPLKRKHSKRWEEPCSRLLCMRGFLQRDKRRSGIWPRGGVGAALRNSFEACIFKPYGRLSRILFGRGICSQQSHVTLLGKACRAMMAACSWKALDPSGSSKKVPIILACTYSNFPHSSRRIIYRTRHLPLCCIFQPNLWRNLFADMNLIQ